MKVQENIINNEVNPILVESLALLNSIDYEKPLKADDFKNIANNYEYWLANTSADKRAKVRQQMTETQKGETSEVLGILEKLLEDSNYVFSEKEKAILDKYPEVLEKLNINKDTYKSTDENRKLKDAQKKKIELQNVIKNWAEKGELTEENLKKSIEADDNLVEIAKLQGLNIAETVKSFHEKNFQIKTDKDVVELSPDELETSFSTHEALEEIGESTGFTKISSNELEVYFYLEFETIPDLALENTPEVEVSNVQPENNFTEITAEKPLKEELEEATQEQPEEPDYEAPTIEVDDNVVEKKGLSKWFDRLKQSRNPLARLITGQLGKKQDNLLNAADTQKTETNYEDKPSTGRFDATDTALVPVGKGVRNSFIQAMEKIFRRENKSKEPVQVLEPVTPKNAFNERYVVDTSSLGNNNIIVPEDVKTKANNNIKQTETPTKQYEGWSK